MKKHLAVLVLDMAQNFKATMVTVFILLIGEGIWFIFTGLKGAELGDTISPIFNSPVVFWIIWGICMVNLIWRSIKRKRLNETDIKSVIS